MDTTDILESGQLTDILPEKTPEEIAAEEAEAARLAAEAEAEAEAARIAEEQRRARVAVQVPNLVKLMRRRWHGTMDESIDAVFAAAEPEAFEKARELWGQEEAAYNAKRGPTKAPVVSHVAVPREQPKKRRSK